MILIFLNYNSINMSTVQDSKQEIIGCLGFDNLGTLFKEYENIIRFDYY